ncbi:MAG: GNAT family N-acetyltransferase [Candidatus Limnocylindria bacterium]
MSVLVVSPRLVLREFAPDDALAVQRYAGDAEVLRYLSWGPNDLDATRGFLARVAEHASRAPRQMFELAVVRRDDDELIGGLGLVQRSSLLRDASVGYVLRRDSWGHGYATEAVRSVVEYGFGTPCLHRIWATCDVDNVASARVLEKAGMRREGMLRSYMPRREGWRDSYLYALIDSYPREAP